jgi:hypothetical protein
MANRGYIVIAASGGCVAWTKGLGFIGKGWLFSQLMHAAKGTSYIEAPLSRFMGPCGWSPEAPPLDRRHREHIEDFDMRRLIRVGMRCGGPGTKHGYAWFVRFSD